MGPVIVMIAGMVKDIGAFMGLLIIVLIAFGVAIEGMRHPFGMSTGYLARLGYETGLVNALDVVFDHNSWRIFGELFLEDVQVHIQHTYLLV